MEIAIVLMIGACAAAFWAHWLFDSGRGPAWVRLVIPLVLVGATTCAGLSVLTLHRAFDAAAHANPSEKATGLAEGITSATSYAVVGIGIVLAVMVLLGVLTIRAASPRSPRSPRSPG